MNVTVLHHVKPWYRLVFSNPVFFSLAPPRPPQHPFLLNYPCRWLGLQPGPTAWWGNFVGDVAWTIEPITVFLAPYLVLRRAQPGKTKTS